MYSGDEICVAEMFGFKYYVWFVFIDGAEKEASWCGEIGRMFSCFEMIEDLKILNNKFIY